MICMGETLQDESAQRLTINETQFQWKRGADTAQEAAAWAVAEI